MDDLKVSIPARNRALEGTRSFISRTPGLIRCARCPAPSCGRQVPLRWNSSEGQAVSRKARQGEDEARSRLSPHACLKTGLLWADRKTVLREPLHAGCAIIRLCSNGLRRERGSPSPHWNGDLTHSEMADLIERFFDGKGLYAQEWNDFVEVSQNDWRMDAYRRCCYEL